MPLFVFSTEPLGEAGTILTLELCLPSEGTKLVTIPKSKILILHCDQQLSIPKICCKQHCFKQPVFLMAAAHLEEPSLTVEKLLLHQWDL